MALHAQKRFLALMVLGLVMILTWQVQAQESEPVSAPEILSQETPQPTSPLLIPTTPAPTSEAVPFEEESLPIVPSSPVENLPPAENTQIRESIPPAQTLPPVASPRLLENAPTLPVTITDAPTEDLEPQPSSLLSPLPSQSTSEINTHLPQDLSPYGMFIQADIIVQSVMIGLLAASILTWAIWLAKFIEIFMAKRRARQAVKALISSRSLAEAIEKAQNKKGVTSRLIMAAAAEVRLSLGAVDGAGHAGMKERVSSHLTRIEVRSGRIISRGTGVLASIGSVAPFVGLFGTVWGIMNAFIGISHAQTTNLAVVAPGIAEALLATAMGLFAAIPAVVIYNFFARSITVYRQMLADISAAIERLVSRDLDFRTAHKKAGQPLLETVGE